MAEIRISKLAKQFSIGVQTLVDFLNEKGAGLGTDPNAKISDEYLPAIEAKFGEDLKLKKDAENVVIKLKDIVERGAKKKNEQEEEEEIVEKEIVIKTNALNSEAAPAVEKKPEPEPVPAKPAAPVVEKPVAEKVEESKEKLAEWLASHPMTYKDGKQYSVTAEKQSLLNGNLSSYERAQGANPSINYPLKWNATGEECTEWEYEDLVGLSLAIAAYVAPKVAEQQAIEIAINACSTIEELNGVVIAYE